MQKNVYALLALLILIIGCEPKEGNGQQAVKLGNEVLLESYLPDLEGKRVGLLMNPTSRVDGVHMVDTLLNLGVNVTALFAAEHGFRGQAGAGEIIEDGIDQQTGLPVFSLYGSTRKPTPKMLEKVDLILLDLPDMGLRFYTYNSTMGLVMEATAEHGKELWILDRPNPLGGEYVAGWILEEKYKSFVGSFPMPIAYGLTMGEIAKMAVGEGTLKLDTTPDFQVIKAEGWQRTMIWLETGLEWIPPSPNLPTFEHVFAYVGTVIFEATNLSEGRGTHHPFLQIGSPTLKIDRQELEMLAQKHHVKLDTVSFTPQSIPGMAPTPKLEGELCHGFRISFEGDYSQTNPLKLGLDLLKFTQKHDPNFEITSFANKLFGIDLQRIIDEKKEIPDWNTDVKAFKIKRNPYLLYE